MFLQIYLDEKLNLVGQLLLAVLLMFYTIDKIQVT